MMRRKGIEDPNGRVEGNFTVLARIVIVCLVALLALPVGEVVRSSSVSTRSGDEAAPSAAAKQRKDGKKGKRKFKTVTRIFANAGPITIPVTGAPNEEGVADPYPSTIQVSKLKKGKILDVNLILTNLNHESPQSLDFMLAATQLPGRTAVVMNNVGTDAPPNTTLTLDDQAAAPLPDGDDFFSGRFQPTSDGTVIPPFPAPAPAAGGNALLGVFNGGNPNGTWQLFVQDETDGTSGNLAGGWALEITAKVKAKDKKSGKGKRK
jgi:hypothetical protein